MALTIFLDGGFNGTACSTDENTTPIHNMGGTAVDSMVEIQELSTGIETAVEGSGRHAVGHHRAVPVTFRTRFGKHGPEWFKACDQNQEFNGTFHMFRNNLTSGEVEPLGQFTVARGRILSVRFVSPNVLDPDGASQHAFIEIAAVYHSLTITSADGTEHIIEWQNRS